MSEPQILPVATAADVEMLLGRELDESELRRADALIVAASILIAEFTGADPYAPAPQVHAVVGAQMVARAMGAPQEMIGVTGSTDTTGPFTHTRQYATAFSEGGVWLSSMDKQMLGGGKRHTSVRMVSDRYS